MMPPSKVAVVDVRGDVAAAVEQAMSLAQWTKAVPAGADVCLKPNLCWDYLMPGFQTTPWVLEAVIEIVRNHVGELVVVEADTSTTSADRGARSTGLLDVCRRHAIPFVNLSREPFVAVPISSGLHFQHQVELPEILTRTHLISLPVLKTHCLTGMTGAIKNQYGCLPLNRYLYHPILDRVLADLLSVLRPSFCLMDGTIGAEGDGPKEGEPRVADLLLASTDPVAMDAVAARVMGLDPDEIEHIQACARQGLGQADLKQISVVGRDIGDLNLRFRPARKNLVAIVDLAVRVPVIGPLIFDTPLIRLFRWGAQSNYLVWLALKGRHYRTRIRDNSWYAEQWWPESGAPSAASQADTAS
jgi:uncharacterized protein (DUF362 family)